MSSQSDDEYYTVQGRISKYDNDGNPVTDETLGPGGSRRDDGTLSVLVEDSHILEENDDEERDSDWEKIVVDVLLVGIGAATAYAYSRRHDIKDWLNGVIAPAREKLRSLRSTGTGAPPASGTELAISVIERVRPTELTDELVVLTSQEPRTMSLEEWQRRMLSCAFALRLLQENAEAMRDVVVLDADECEAIERGQRILDSAAGRAAIKQLVDTTSAEPEQQAKLLQALSGGGNIANLIAEVPALQQEKPEGPDLSS